MNDTGTLKVTTPTERKIVLTRDFDAPRSLVFDALTKPSCSNVGCSDRPASRCRSARSI
jgi:hypothetical protein